MPKSRAEKLQPKHESTGERLSRFGRNFNIVVGAVALAGAAIVPGPNVLISGYAYFNFMQAGGFELLRQHVKKKAKQQPKNN
jgi:hypothetical protein